MINISFYDGYCKEYQVLQNIKVSDEEFTKSVMIIPNEDMPHAILLDSYNKGYCRIAFDEFSNLVFLEQLMSIQ